MSGLEYYSAKWGSDLQTFKHDVLENLGLQISGISRQQAPSMLVSIGAQHSHLHQVLLPIPTIHTMRGCIIAAGQTAHRIPAISSWNFWFFGARVYSYKLIFSKPVIRSISDSVPDGGRYLLEDIFCQIRWSENGTWLYFL